MPDSDSRSTDFKKAVASADKRGDPASLLELLTGRGVTVDKKDNDRLLLQALDDVLDDLLGKHMREGFYDYMERNYYLGREGIPSHLRDFLLVLERTSGKSGKTIERTLARRLCSKL